MRKIQYYIRREEKLVNVTPEEFQAYVESKSNKTQIYTIRVGDYILEVTKDKYMEFYREKSREKYLFRQAAIYQEISYNNMDTDDLLGIDVIPDESIPVEDEAIQNIQFEKLRRCIELLPLEEQKFIKIAYFDNMSERDMAKSFGISQPAIHKRKIKILSFLKKHMEI